MLVPIGGLGSQNLGDLFLAEATRDLREAQVLSRSIRPLVREARSVQLAASDACNVAFQRIKEAGVLLRAANAKVCKANEDYQAAKAANAASLADALARNAPFERREADDVSRIFNALSAAENSAEEACDVFDASCLALEEVKANFREAEAGFKKLYDSLHSVNQDVERAHLRLVCIQSQNAIDIAAIAVRISSEAMDDVESAQDSAEEAFKALQEALLIKDEAKIAYEAAGAHLAELEACFKAKRDCYLEAREVNCPYLYLKESDVSNAALACKEAYEANTVACHTFAEASINVDIADDRFGAKKARVKVCLARAEEARIRVEEAEAEAVRMVAIYGGRLI